jgi:hypothetical protein
MGYPRFEMLDLLKLLVGVFRVVSQRDTTYGSSDIIPT